MSAHFEWAKALRTHGTQIGREGMSRAVINAVEKFDGSYMGAMILAGRLKAITQMAKCDAYWSEKVDIGFHAQLDETLRANHAAKVADVLAQERSR